MCIMVHFSKLSPSSDSLGSDNKMFTVTWNSLDVETAYLLIISAKPLPLVPGLMLSKSIINLRT